jgi:16S rRNA (guanine1207-N2)-methyltransferase
MTCKATELMGHYFDEETDAPSDPRDVTWRLPDHSFTLRTDRGVFGYDRVDVGTKLLLLKAPSPPIDGHLVDLGCGTGAIAITLARRSPGATVWAVDSNRRARQLCEHNARANGVANVNVVGPAEFPADIAVAALWSNPPIRIGKLALHALLLTWLGRLEAGGQAWLTVQKHLGADSLQRWLSEQGWPCQRVAVGGGFRILHAQRTTATPS